MKALQFVESIPRYLLTKAFGHLFPGIYWSPLSCLQYREVPIPPLPNEQWVRVKVRYGGICGSDMGTISLHASPMFSALVSFPFTLGHEGVGSIGELGREARGFTLDERVVVDPTLNCQVRGLDTLCPACARGDINLCRRTTEGDISPGLLTGNCRDTGGSWSPYLVAHISQLLKVPPSVSDENGVMVEPLAVALHAVLRNQPQDGETILVMGAGTIGMCLLAGLRALGYKNRTLILAKYPFQGEMARRYGADEVIQLGPGTTHYGELASALGGRLLKPRLGKPVMVGGPDMIYDCVGSSASLNDALRLTRRGGRMVLVGGAAVPKGVDWTPLWLNEIEIRGSWIYGLETYRGKPIRTTQLALDLMAQGKADLTPLVTHRFRLEKYRQALATVFHGGSREVMKAVFAFE